MTQPTKAEAVALPVAVDDHDVSEIVRIDYAARKLTVVAGAPKSNTLIGIRFDDVVAYRVEKADLPSIIGLTFRGAVARNNPKPDSWS